MFFVKHLLFFAAVSYNIHALPSCMACDNPKERTEKIAWKMNEYDLVFLQEDFCFNENFLKYSKQTLIRQRDSERWTSRLFGCSFDTGLAILTNFKVIDAEAVKFKRCNGWIGSDFDCWAEKGFLHAQLMINEKVVDVYNVHLDAGESKEDTRAREGQLVQLIDYIDKHKATKLIVAGDFNMGRGDETKKNDRLFEHFKLILNLQEQPHNDTIDHILYRGFETENYMMQDIGLSDHPMMKLEIGEL